MYTPFFFFFFYNGGEQKRGHTIEDELVNVRPLFLIVYLFFFFFADPPPPVEAVVLALAGGTTVVTAVMAKSMSRSSAAFGLTMLSHRAIAAVTLSRSPSFEGCTSSILRSSCSPYMFSMTLNDSRKATIEIEVAVPDAFDGVVCVKPYHRWYKVCTPAS